MHFSQKRATRECVYLVRLVWPFFLLWPWPVPDDLETRAWPRCCEHKDLHTKHQLSISRLPKVTARTEQTDRPEWTHYHAVFVGG